MTEHATEKRPFDFFAACLAAGIVGPFVIWGLYEVFQNYWAMGIGSVLFISFVFWGFGRIRIE